MIVDELIKHLQKLSLAGYGGHEMMIIITSEPRVGFVARVVAPSPEETEPLPWLLAEPTDVDGTRYAPEYLLG